MTIPRIYSPSVLEKEKICKLGADNYRYLRQVLRLKPGSAVAVFDGFGHEFAAVIRNYAANKVELELGGEIETVRSEIKITLGQALPKAGKMDTIIRYAAELGADVIIPFSAARSVSRIAAEKGEEKRVRWQKIAREAARLSRSSQMTEVFPICSFDTLLAHAGSDQLKMIFWEEENQKSMKEILADSSTVKNRNFFIVVGPEGGFSKDEIMKSRDAGFVSVSLGRQILRVETAALAIISIIQYDKGVFSNF